MTFVSPSFYININYVVFDVYVCMCTADKMGQCSVRDTLAGDHWGRFKTRDQ